MVIKSGERKIRIINDQDAWKYGGWYKGLVGKEFSAIIYDIICAEYIVAYEDGYKVLPEKSVEIVSDIP